MEQFEDGKEDHNVLAKLSGEEALINAHVKERLTEFVYQVFDHQRDKEVKVGQFLDRAAAEKYIDKCLD